MTLFLFFSFFAEESELQINAIIAAQTERYKLFICLWGLSQATLTRFCPLLTTYILTPCWHLWRNSLTVIGGETCIPLTFPVPPTYLVLSTHFVNEPLIFICLVTQKYRVEELKVVITRLVSFMIERVIFFKQELFRKMKWWNWKCDDIAWFFQQCSV